jgi:hypothetical protein
MTGSDSRRMLSNIFLGKVVAPRPAMKIETTASLNENRNANNAATIMPGRSTGKVTQKKVRMGPAASASYINLTAGGKGASRYSSTQSRLTPLALTGSLHFLISLVTNCLR